MNTENKKPAPLYKLGSHGDEVRQIQHGLWNLGYYKGHVDGKFGGHTESSVRNLQRDNGLAVDGIVGPDTWKKIFGDNDIPFPKLISKPLPYRCLALSGTFETGLAIPECFSGISGDFDGQGMSLGILQWNFGKGTLQTLLLELLENERHIAESIFHDRFETLLKVLCSDKQELMKFVRSIQHPAMHSIYEPWKGMFKALGRNERFREIQVKHAAEEYKTALALCRDYGLWSERAVALMFDIIVQNGGIPHLTKLRIMKKFKPLSEQLSFDELEVMKMRIIANIRAEASEQIWVEDVRARKLCCANGGGSVHGIGYDIGAQFGIGLRRIEGF
ncbi:MAG: peptidoglycan-binding protein [Nitrospirae bacterium]|nr:MAG: peptidoglycan-binding protein [Nitrospirota bacterium]